MARIPARISRAIDRLIKENRNQDNSETIRKIVSRNQAQTARKGK